MTTVALRAAVVACVVSAFELLMHSGRGADIGDMRHFLMDAGMLFPVALVALMAGRRLCDGRSLADALVRATAGAIVVAAAMVPATGVHRLAHALEGGVMSGMSHAADGPVFDLRHGFADALPAMPIAALAFLVTELIRGASTRTWNKRIAAAVAAISLIPPGAGAAGPVITPFTAPLQIPPVLTGSDISLTAAETDEQILPGSPTKMWTYNGSFPGPTIRRPSGEPTRVTLVNNLPPAAGELTLHHHGNHSASADDGQPHSELVPTGASRTYTYELMEAGAPERGAIQWYHDHRMDVTGRNVWKGLAGMFIVDDPEEATINSLLPNGAFDVPLMIADRSFDANNQIPYTFSSGGVVGNVTTVNGTPLPYFAVSTRKYRFRVLNASNNRSYDLAMSDGRPMIQVGSDSGLLPAPVSRSRTLLGPAERADVVIDFSGAAIGSNMVMRNLAGFGNYASVMQFRVTSSAQDGSVIPSVLRPSPSLSLTDIAADRLWVLGQDIDPPMWTINGQGFGHDRVDAKPKLGTAERWTFVNTTSVDHIVHIHDVDWKVVARTGGLPPDPNLLPDESGLKESFRIRPNETVTVAARFTDHLGRYVLHCHMLEHEDFAMMAQFEVVP